MNLGLRGEGTPGGEYYSLNVQVSCGQEDQPGIAGDIGLHKSRLCSFVEFLSKRTRVLQGARGNREKKEGNDNLVIGHGQKQ
jgi:hypothetical protein